jgi:hypothetical protein
MNTAYTTRLLQLVIATLFLFVVVLPLHAEEHYEPLPDEGTKYAIGSEYSFVYKFAKKPQLGIAILKIEVADKDGKKDSTLKISGESGMPSMPGHHDSGEVAFKLNTEGDYLLPVDVVMPGDWEVKVIFRKENTILYRGSIKFDI